MKLKQFRNSINLSQKSMAQKLGVTLSLYEKVESGRCGISSNFIKRFKHNFPDASIDEIFFNENSNKIAQ